MGMRNDTKDVPIKKSQLERGYRNNDNFMTIFSLRYGQINFTYLLETTKSLILITLLIIIPAFGVGQEYGNQFQGNQNITLPEPQNYNLSDIERSDLLFMRQEEQMAHDLYMVWYEMYSIPIFWNIAEAETTHASEVQFLLDRYQVPSDMIGNLSLGYNNPEIQALADALSEQGAQSLTDALKAGVAIEETDIADLDKAIANTTRPDIIQVYTNLRNGSENHLRAFTSQLS